MYTKSFISKLQLILAVAVMFVVAQKGTAGPDFNINGIGVVNRPYGHTFWMGDDLIIGVTLRNHGDDWSGSYSVEYYVSADTTITSADYYLGSVTRADVAPFSDDSFQATFAIPSTMPANWYWIGIIVVCSADGDLGDNVDYATEGAIRILVPVADLTVARVAGVDTWCRPGGLLRIATEIKNEGHRTSAAYSVEYYLATRKVGVASRGGLEKGGTDAFDAEFVLPADTPQGSYEIMAKVICSDDANTGNNEGRTVTLIQVGPFADLAVLSVDAADGVYVPGQQIVVHSLVKNIGDKTSDGYTVRYYMSNDAEITTTDQCIGEITRGALASSVQDRFDATCRLPTYVPQGSRFIGAIVICTNDGSLANNQGSDATPITLVHSAGYACGRITYKDLDGWEHPVRYALVRIYDADNNSDPLDDRVIGETHTDQDGNYGILVLKDQKSGQQVYVKVFTQAVAGVYAGTTSGICSVRDDVLYEVYSLKSPLYSHPRDASLTANFTAMDSDGGFMVYDSVIEGFHKAKTFFDIEPNEIPVYWPSSDNGTYYDPNEGIHIGQEDRGDRDVILHEYGHYIAQLGDFAQGDDGGHPMHYWRIDLRYSPSSRIDEHARNLAFREAWATLFSIAVQRGDVWYPYSGDDKYQDYDEKLRARFTLDLERETRYHKQPGEFYENMNTCALWDIFDDNCDGDDNQDTLSDTSLSKIWTVLRESRPEDVKDFWNGWFERYACVKEMMRIFKDHGMSFPYLGPSTAVEGFETGDFKAFTWTHPGDQPWTITSDVRHQGAYSAKTGIIGNSQKSTLQISIKVDEGLIRFWRKVSTEEGFDKLQFLIDGSAMGDWSGDLDWKQIEISVRPGMHTFTWTYVKNHVGAAGTDAAWLDDIEFPIW